MPDIPTIPRKSSGVAGRIVYASSVTGVVLDCDLSTGLTAAGSAPTDNAARLNAVLATATSTAPVHLVIDGGTALSAPLVIPAAGHVAITGQGWDTGFYMLSASNANGIQNFPDTDLANLQCWGPPAATPINGKNIHLSRFRLSGNRGTYPNGNSSGHRDGTITDGSITGSSPDARGPYTAGYWLAGIVLSAVDNVTIERVWVYDAPAYQIDLYACSRVRIRDCRVEAASASEGNQDGIHVNSGCWDVKISGCWVLSGDDAFAFNVDEGESPFVTDPLANSDLVVEDCTVRNCITLGRVHGSGAPTRRVRFSGISGNVQWWGLLIGNDGTTAGNENNHSILLENFDVQVTNPIGTYNGALFPVTSSCGLLELNKIRMVEPTSATPLLWVGSQNANPVISALRMVDCGIHRNHLANAAAPLITGTYGTVGDLVIDGCYLTEESGRAYTDISPLIDTGHLTIPRISLSGSYKGAGTILNIPSTSTVGRVVVPDLDHTANTGSATAHSIVAAGSTVPVSVGRFSLVNCASLISGTASIVGTILAPVRVATPVALTDASTIMIDFSASDFRHVTFAGNRTIAFTNATPGQVLRLMTTQDSTGSRVPTWPTLAGPTPTLSTGSGKRDLIVLTVLPDASVTADVAKANF